MKIKRLFPLFIILLLTVFVFSGCTKKEQTQDQEQNQQQQEEQAQNQAQDQGMFSGKLKDLMSGGKTLKCTWTYRNNGTVAESVVYVDGEKYASEITVPDQEDSSMVVHSVYDGEWSYTWTEGMKQGMKMRPADFEGMGEGEQYQQQQQNQEGAENGYANFVNEEYDFDCQNWRSDNSKFTVPADVEFADFGEQMKQMEQAAEDMKKNMESVCNMLQGEEKTKCLEDLKN